MDNVVIEMIGQRRREMATTTAGLKKPDLLSRFRGSIEDDNKLRDIENSVVYEQRRPGTILSPVRVVRDYFVLR
ncbi:hypothetical protein AHAS_Ahas10G0114600 [Arachis hypogaea]